MELPSNVYDTVIASVWRTLGGEDGDQGALISVSALSGCCGAGLIWGGARALGCFQSNLRSSKFPSFLRS